ncbi:MAG: glycosyltransferase family 39 protein [Candidatus Omnitrophota bacterium]
MIRDRARGENRGYLILLFVLAAFTVRLAAIFALRYHTHPNVWEFDTMAMNILEGKGYVYHNLSIDQKLCGYPFFPYFSALIHWITHRNYLAFEIIQVALASLAVIPLAILTRKLFGLSASLIAQAAYCLHPGLIVYAGKIHELTLSVFLLLLICWMVACVKKNTVTVATLGLLIGAGTLLRPTFIFFLPAFFIYVTLTRIGGRRIAYYTAVATVTSALLMAPWIYRGYRLYHRFIFITTSSAEHLWRGNNPYASGTSLTKDHVDIIAAAGHNFERRLYALDEMGQYDFFRREALSYIRAQPFHFMKMTVKKFVYFWSFSPQAGMEYPPLWLFVYKIIYVFLFAGILAGLYTIGVNRGVLDMPAIIFLIAFCLMLSLAHALYYVETRHRWMIEPLLMAFSAYGYSAVLDKAKAVIANRVTCH